MTLNNNISVSNDSSDSCDKKKKSDGREKNYEKPFLMTNCFDENHNSDKTK